MLELLTVFCVIILFVVTLVYVVDSYGNNDKPLEQWRGRDVVMPWLIVFKVIYRVIRNGW